ncbi:MAG: hypothetical protein LBV33_03290 [Lachnospiraceae bacterium]|jgi:hypothetical protein|nr:hypothetical protein [Lachnospiraceae bacterium]
MADDFIESLISGSINFSDAISKLKVCTFRKEIYRKLHKEVSFEHASLIRYLFSIEISERSKSPHEEDDTYDFEVFYWCIFLLSRIGDVTDVKAIWGAKYLDFDASIGVEMEFLVGAGLENTIHFLEGENDKISSKILVYLLGCKEQGGFEEMDAWYNFRYNYFLKMV